MILVWIIKSNLKKQEMLLILSVFVKNGTAQLRYSHFLFLYQINCVYAATLADPEAAGAAASLEVLSKIVSIPKSS